MNIQMRQEEKGYMEGRGRPRRSDCSVFGSALLPYVALPITIYFSVFSVTEEKIVPIYLVCLSASVVFAKYCQVLK